MAQKAEAGFHKEFESTEERDRWVEKTFPERRGLSTPGLYKIRGGKLVILMKDVWIEGKKAIDTARAQEVQ